MTNELRRLWVAAVGAGYEDGHVKGRIGRKNADGSISIATERDGFLYVTLSSDASQAVDVAFNASVRPIYNLPVKMRRIGGHLVIVGMNDDPSMLGAFLGGSPPGAPAHNHRTGSGLEYEVESFWLEPGRVLWSGTGNVVRIRPLHYRYHHTEKYYPGGTLDLTSNLPATANKWAWIVVGINPATNAAVAVTGALYDAQVDLTPARIADVNMLDYIPLGAVQAKNGDTSLSSRSRYADARHWLDERIRLDDLTNATITTPADGEVLTYDTITEKWVNEAAAADVAAQIHAAADKPTPVDADELGLVDSAAAWVLKRLTWANLKATLQAAFNSIYLVKAGLAGGQTAFGGTAASENAIINSTAHATKGEVKLANDGGRVTIRRSAAGAYTLHIGGAGVAPADFALESNAGRKFLMRAGDVSPFTVFGTESDHSFSIITNGVERLRFTAQAAAGRFGFFGAGVATFAPQGGIHFHDGTTGKLIHTVSVSDGTSVTVIPDGVGDVLKMLFAQSITTPSSGSPLLTQRFPTPGSGDETLYSSGSDVLVIRVTAGGAIQLQRTGGTLTYQVSLNLFWM